MFFDGQKTNVFIRNKNENGELYRLQQPIGKLYSFGKGPFEEELDELTALKLQNEILKIQMKLLKKYIISERK